MCGKKCTKIVNIGVMKNRVVLLHVLFGGVHYLIQPSVTTLRAVSNTEIYTS
jgi:hypothetical protein